MEEILEFCFKKFAAVWLFRNFLFSVLPVILLIPSKGTAGLSAVWIPVFFFAVFAAVDFLFFIGQEEDLVKLLLDEMCIRDRVLTRQRLIAVHIC